MDAYKVYHSDIQGFESDEQYYLDVKKAEKDFYNRVKKVLEDEPIAEREDLHDGGRPWKIQTKCPINKNLKLKFDYSKWYSWNTPECGEEAEITHEQIIFERITINE